MTMEHFKTCDWIGCGGCGPQPKLAAKLLADARATDPGRSAGAVRHKRPSGDVLVSWNRVDKRYDVGTEARSLAQGRRSDVLPILEKLLGA
jgi:hypothetical protein